MDEAIRRLRAEAHRLAQGKPPSQLQLVLGQALAWPTWGGRRLSVQMDRELRVRVVPSTVQRILRRAGLGRRRSEPRTEPAVADTPERPGHRSRCQPGDE